MQRPLFRMVLLGLCAAWACADSGTSQSDLGAGGSLAPAAGTGIGNAGSAGSPLAAGSGTAGDATAAGRGAAGSALAGAAAAGSSGVAGSAPAGSGGAVAAGSGGAVAAGSGGAGAAGGAAAGSGGSGSLQPITIWIAGDSTVANGETPCPVGWGADFQSHFVDRAKVVNSAVGGRSVRTWLYNVQTTMGPDGECVLGKDASGQPTIQARWKQMLDGMHAGDYLFIQFGINDSSATCDRHVGLEAFKDSYGMMAMAAKQRGAQPIFLTPVSAIACDGAKAKGTRGGYVTATQEAAAKYDVPLIDLHAASVQLYTSLGLCPIPGGGDVTASTGGKTGAFFCEDHTHFERSGAAQIAELIVKALHDDAIGLRDYLK